MISTKKNSMGYTPLAWAALNGHEEVVRILLGQDDIDPDKPDEYDQTPLLWAASMGHEGVVKLLFKCVNSERDLFYVDNTRQVRGCCQGTLSEEVG